jgi:hypothetical protein
MFYNLDRATMEQLQAVLRTGDVRAIGELIRGTIAKNLTQENWLDVVFTPTTGTEFIVPAEVIGKTAMKVVRGQILESFKAGSRKVMLSGERYASKPSMDAGDLQKGDVASLADMLSFAQQGLQDMIMADGYALLNASCKYRDPNFLTVVDDGSDEAGAPAYLPVLRRRIKQVMNQVADTTRSRTVRGIIGRKVLVADLVEGDLSPINRAKFELSSEVVPGEFRGIPIVSLSGAADENGNPIFPANELFVVGEGAGSYSISSPLNITALPQMDIQQAWELWMEVIMALWYKSQVYRIYIIDTTAGNFTRIVSADATQVVLNTDKYVDAATITNTSVKILSEDGPAGADFAVNGVVVEPDGKTVTLTLAAPLTPGTYAVYNTADVKDIGATAFNATAFLTPIGTFTL